MSSALYRKYRPVSFDGVIGQDHIVKTLVNQIKGNKLCHAYLFCGARGVGKTSLARIFARAVNCQSKDSPSLPCLKCPTCQANAHENFDIIEIDAASNNGVEDARALRETVKYLPAVGTKKVYIIDEVHMLSTAAFNALLKTLEEPPEHVIFILATTESHKLPATVLSRCVRFDFKLLSVSALTTLLSKIFNAEGKDFETDALRAISSYAQGSVRDALSLADTCINISSNILTLKQVDELIGNDDQKIETLLAYINHANIRGSIEILQSMRESGVNMAVCAKNIAATARDVLAVKLDENLLDTTLSRFERLKAMADDFSVSFLAGTIELFLSAQSELRYSISPHLFIEGLVLRASKIYSLDLNSIDERLNRLERGINNALISPNLPLNTQKDDMPTLNTPPELTPLDKPISEPESQSSQITINANKQITPTKLLGRIITYFRKNSPPRMLQALASIQPLNVSLKDGTLKIYADKETYLFFCDDAFINELNSAILSEGLSYKIKIEKDTKSADIEKEAEQILSEFGIDKVNIIKG